MDKQSISNVIRRPWGGKLDSGRFAAGGAFGADAAAMAGLLLRKFCELSLLATLVAVPLAYQFNLTPANTDLVRRAVESLFGLFGGTAQHATIFFTSQVEPWVVGLMSTLDIKFAAWAVLGLMMIAGFAGGRFLEAATGRPVFEETDPLAERSRDRRHRLVPLVCITGFLAFSLASFLLWPPEMPAEARALAGKSGGGGFFFSASAWLQVAFAGFFFIVAEDVIRERRFVTKILALILAMGFLAALVVLLQKIEFGPLVRNWIKFDESSSRNNLGAFIGHNTGLSAFLVPPVLIALVWIVGVQPRRRRLLRVALVLVLLVMLQALVLAQSRAVVPIVLAAALALIAAMRRRSCLRVRSRVFLWVPVAVFFLVLTQLIPSSYNPLYRRDVPLVERVGEFRPSRLITETRLRILVISFAKLIPASSMSPLVGHGFGTFQYVYPKAQGEYFEENPRSVLAPTPLRSMHAHNEYLQTLIETGIVGLGLLMAALVFILRGGLAVLKRTLLPYHISTQLAVFFSIAAMLLHCAVDLPLRVAPLALLLTVLLAIWSAGDRLWVFPVREPEPETPSDDAAEEPEAPKRRRFALVGAAAALALSAAFLWGSAEICRRTLGPWISASTLGVKFENLLPYATNPAPQYDALREEVFEDAKLARRILWNGEGHRNSAQAMYARAAANFRHADALRSAGNTQQAAGLREFAMTQAKGALNDLNMSLGDERLHSTYTMRSYVNQLMAANTIPPERDSYLAAELEDLYRAVLMNPGDPAAIYRLVERLERNESANRTEIQRYMALLHHFHPDYFRRSVYGRALDAIALEEPLLAQRLMANVIAAVPAEPEFRLTRALTWTRIPEPPASDPALRQEWLAGLESARSAAEEIRSAAPEGKEGALLRESAEMLLVQVAIRLHNDALALRELRRPSGFAFVSDAMRKSMELGLLRRMGGDTRETEALEEDIRALGEKGSHALTVAGVTFYSLFDDYREALKWLERRRDSQPPMDLVGHVLLYKAYTRLGMHEQARALEATIRTLDGTPYAQFAAGEIVRRARDQAEAAP